MSNALPAHWRQLALAPPRAAAAPVCSGRSRVNADDFRVEELLGFTPDGEGAHALLQVRKREANTEWVAKKLAMLAGVRAQDVGYAGLKDRHAVTTQWFTVPRGAKPAPVESWLGQGGEGFEVLAAYAHRRKLPRGALAGNQFEIVLRHVTGDARGVLERLATLAAEGVPNYFGPQRFGRDAGNLQEPPRAGRGFAISAARSLIFNAVLAKRIELGNWNQLQTGDCANLDGRGSYFAVQPEGADSAVALRTRLETQDIHPTGPMWGAGELPSALAVRELEQSVAAQFGALCAALADVGLVQERRALRVALREAAGASEIAADGSLVLRLRFTLRSGAFATTVLRELGEFGGPEIADA